MQDSSEPKGLAEGAATVLGLEHVIILPALTAEPPQLAQPASTDSMQLLSGVYSVSDVVESVGACWCFNG